MKIIFALLVLTSLSYAQVNTGDMIKAKNYNGSTHQIGDVKTSLLELADFQSIHGDCWRQYNTNSANVDLTGTELANYLGNSIPSSANRVLRGKGTLTNQATGGTQEDAYQDHRHRNSWVAEQNNLQSQSITLRYTGSTLPSALNSQGVFGTVPHNNFGQIEDDSTGTTHPNSSNARTSTETRVKNIAVNMYIKVNKECN